MVVDFRRTRSDHSPLNIDGSIVEIVKSTKFLGVHLEEDLTWSLNTSSITRKAQQCLYFLRRLRKAHLPLSILSTFYRGTVESILSSCITSWFGNCTISDCKTLQRIVRTAEKIIGVSLPSITDIYSTRCIRKANSIVGDSTHPSHTLFTLLPSGKRYRSIRTRTTRLLNSFFPQAIRHLNRELNWTHTHTHMPLYIYIYINPVYTCQFNICNDAHIVLCTLSTTYHDCGTFSFSESLTMIVAHSLLFFAQSRPICCLHCLVLPCLSVHFCCLSS
uniref:Alkylated DNA repair protein AlkB homologue 8 N-terminal domain-containing protein n=1 Tax=Mastacembelus armatus TaxID=205130 RepID=A0A7N9AV81_9TELE